MLQGKSGVSQRAHCDPPAALSNGSHVNRALLTRIPQCPAGQRQDRTESTQLATNPRARLTSCPTAISDLTAFFLLPYTHPLFCRMEKAPPRQPKVAWEEVAAPEESSSAEEPAVVTMVEPLQLNARWVPDFAKSTMDFIQAFASSPTQFQDKEQKLEFLLSICTLCRDANLYDFSDDLNDFCSRYKLVEMVQMLLNLEPKHEICTRVRRLAMLAFAQLSTIGTVLETRKVLRLCFNSVFFLRPLEEMSSVEATLCSQALRSMDTMLEVMLLSSPASKISEMMQDMLEILLQYLFSDLMAAQERVLGRIRVLSHLLAKYSTEKTDEDEDNGAASGQIQIAVLGKLLGHLFFKLFRPENKIAVVVDILCSLMTFLSAQKCATLPEDHVQPPEHWESEIISWVNAPNTWKVEAFGRYLRPAERTGVVLEAIEILGRSAFLNKKPPMEFLEEAMKSPEMWLMDVPKVVRHIFAYSDEGNATIAHSFHSLLVLMANKWPGQVIAAALEAAPNFSDKVNLWKSLFSARQTLEKVLKELQFQVQNWHKNIFTRQQQMCLSFLSMLAYGDILESKVRPLYKNLSLLRYPKMEMVPLVLRALETLSESAETAKKMKGLLPEMLKFLGHWSWDISVMALDTFHNLLGQLKKKEASSMAVNVAQRLWFLFDAKEDCVRERSISLFGELLGKTAWRDKKAMRRNSWKALVQLVLHMSDQVPSVAEASKKAVLAVAELLNWKELKHLAQAEQMWKMGECLLAKDSSRADQFVRDGKPYLLNPQAPIREAALRFIGLAARHLTEQSEDTLTAVLLGLRTMKAGERDPSIRSLADQTSLILKALKDRQKSGFSLRTLCRWCC
ncbi:uncharacterized protein LOC128802193 isoform X1 [Vidua chalybeata]|uniref:uncharacterized protein LOC128802193 isoform X1 n=2 Tax=Vidua chalybeata TaxID=81927 RepID=UPI0023A80B90|nr:uncharacterized protein LOC128802193 isoform X1 [Vidua chalybeata]XP_053824416.1 uncharacterized protein LOC128802193 isoform X1 [Vidua chalybeata]XP_053824417.1 uncharacterized protein LOC128802193 isoform X1 [Vidua chalybeata]